jgi:pimeloyl-ACP methyl ester carboxylesterase
MGVISIQNSESSFLFENPKTPTTKALIFLPGMSGEALSERFKPLADAGLDAGFTVVRLSAWQNGKDVARKNLADIHGDIAFVIGYLRERGYTSIAAVGKSFGGTVLLTLPQEIQLAITKRVLWSPAIGIKDNGSNVGTYLSEPLGSLQSLLDLYVDAAYLKAGSSPALIIHGNADDVVPVSNSVKLASVMPDARVFTIEGAGHSYSGKNHEQALIRATLDFLRA